MLCPEIRLLKKATTLTPDNMWARGPTLPAYQIIGITHESNHSKLDLCTCTRIVNSFKIDSVSLVGKCRGHAHLLSVQNKLTLADNPPLNHCHDSSAGELRALQAAPPQLENDNPQIIRSLSREKDVSRSFCR